jgi:hypothetical protein
MKPPSAPFVVAALTCLLFAGAGAQAGPVRWSHDWSRSPGEIISGDQFGTSRIALTDEPASGTLEGAQTVVATSLDTFSTTPASHQNHFLDAAYTLTLQLTDEASGETATVTFGGVFNGTLSTIDADLSTRFTGQTEQSLTLGGNEYVVSLADYRPPGAPGSNVPGSISATVEVRGTDVPPVQDVPEPSAVVLSCVGLSLLGVAVRRRWRR